MTVNSFMTPTLTEDIQTPDAIARLAAKRGKELLPSWRAFVRMVSRNPVAKVELTGGTPCTDGKTIWLRVPMELGLNIPHPDRKVCGNRGTNGRLICRACDVREDVTITILHEVSHIIFDSMAEIDEHEKVVLLKKAVEAEANGNPDSKRSARIWAELKKRGYYNFFEASHTVSPWLGMVLNAVEDVRVNAKMMEAREGTRVMFQAQTTRIFTEGILREDGEMHGWLESPPNAQAVIACYCEASGLKWGDYLSPEITGKLTADKEFKNLCRRAKTARSVRSEFEISVELLATLRRLGFCLVPDEEPEEEEPDPGEGEPGEGEPGEGEPGEGDNPGESESEDGSGGSGSKPEPSEPSKDDDENGGGDSPSDDDSDADSDGKDSDSDGSGDESEADGETDGTGGEGEGDDGDDGEPQEGDLTNPEHTGKTYTEEDYNRDGTVEEVEALFKKFGRHEDDDDKGASTGVAGRPSDSEMIDRAIAQIDFFDSTSQAVWGVNVHTDRKSGKSWASNEWYESDGIDSLKVEERIMSPALMNLRRVFADNRAAKHLSNLKSGKKIDGRVLGRRIPTDDGRLFKRKELPGKKDYFVLIGLDVSGSTMRPGVIETIKQSAFAQAELCQRVGVKFAVYAHTGEYSHSHSGMDLDIYEVKAPGALWDVKAKERLAALRPSSANLDGHTMEFYRKVAQGVKASTRLIMYYTDGAMPLENYTEELEVLQREIEICRRDNINLIGVGIRNDDPVKHGLDTVRLDSIEDVPKIVKELQKRLA